MNENPILIPLSECEDFNLDNLNKPIVISSKNSLNEITPNERNISSKDLKMIRDNTGDKIIINPDDFSDKYDKVNKDKLVLFSQENQLILQTNLFVDKSNDLLIEEKEKVDSVDKDVKKSDKDNSNNNLLNSKNFILAS